MFLIVFLYVLNFLKSYNSEKFIGLATLSVMVQYFSYFLQIIVIDDISESIYNYRIT